MEEIERMDNATSFSTASPLSSTTAVSAETTPLQPRARRSHLAAAMGLAIASAAVSAPYAHAQSQGRGQNPGSVELPRMQVEDEAADSYQVRHSASSKYTAPLVDTPKSVQVIGEKVIEDTAATTLSEALRTVPGITLAMGEGGQPFADRPFLRGFESTSGMMLDGLRDTGSQSRDTFNLEQIEVAKGPNGAVAGRGAPGGTINLVSKTARADDFLRGSVMLGSSATDTRRVSVDGNLRATDQMAVRLNVMVQEADVAGRDGVEDDRWGIAPTLTLGLDSATRAELSYYHFESDGTMDYGHPYDQQTGEPVDVDRDTFYGIWDRDFVETVVDAATLKVEHQIREGLTVANNTRWERTSNDYIATNPDDSHGNVVNGLVFRMPKTRNSDHDFVINQTELQGELATGGVEHSFVAGIEFSREETTAASYTLDTNAPTGPIGRGECHLFGAGAPSGFNCTTLHNPNPNDPWSGAITLGEATDTEVDTRSLYVFDTLTLNPQWLLNLGLRYDDYETKTSTGLRNDDSFVNWQLGVVYKPVPYGSIYLAAGTATNPSGVTAGEGSENLSTTNEDLDPEQSTSYELGTKWELFERRLSLTAALFQTTLEDVHVATEPGRGAPQDAIGEYEVQGIELGFSGHLSARWQVFGGYTWLDSEIVDAGPAALDTNGNQFPNTAENSASLWTTFDITDRLTVGGGAFYVDEVYGNATNTLSVPSYTRVDAMASFEVNEHLTLRVNVQNLTDETYYTRAYASHMAAVGPGRSVLFSADMAL